MRTLLFRRVNFNGVNYYQLFDYSQNFNYNTLFAPFNKRANAEFFYIEPSDNIIVPNESLMNIYYDDGDNLKDISDSELYDKVSRFFNSIFHYFDEENPLVEDIITNIKEKVLFQDKAIRTIVERIQLNQDIIKSSLPTKLKVIQKQNILFAGRAGSGKKSIIETLKPQLKVPCVELYLQPNLKDSIGVIVQGLLDKAKNVEDASHGVVFIRDNYNALSQSIEPDEFDFYQYMRLLTSQEIIKYDGKEVDLRTVTFVFLYDVYDDYSQEDIYDFKNCTNCSTIAFTRDLSVYQKLIILNNPNGRLADYSRMVEEKGYKFVVDSKCLIPIIKMCSINDRSMNTLNAVIDGLISISLDRKITDVFINQSTVELVEKLISEMNNETSDGKSNYVEQNSQYWLEKKVDEIVAKASKYVVGQDEKLRKLVFRLVNNLENANKPIDKNAKEYVNNIIVRGNTGTGKSFLLTNVLSLLDVPYVIVDATKYTEAGYVGGDVEEMLIALFNASGGNLEKAERGILVIDEIDKKASSPDSGGRDVSGGSVQEALYKLAEGSVIQINVGDIAHKKYINFDTSRLTVICAGAFEGIEKLRDKRIGACKIGLKSKSDRIQEEKAKKNGITDDDYIMFGMKAQFMRRLIDVIELDDVTKDQLIEIMKKSETSALKVQQETFLENQNIEIEYEDGFYDALADKALEMKIGITGIKKALAKVFDEIKDYNIRASEVEKIIFTSESVEDHSKVIIVPRGKSKVKRIGN